MPLAASDFPTPTCDHNADVIVVGASIAGLSAVRALIDGGIPPQRIVVLEPGGVDWAASGCTRGLTAPSFWHLYNRLCTSMNADAARMLQFGCENHRRLCDSGVDFPSSGSLYLPGSDFEEEEMRESAEFLRTGGYQVEVLSRQQVEPILGWKPPFAAAFDPGGGGFDPRAGLQALLQPLVQAGVSFYFHVMVQPCPSPSGATIQVEVTPSGSVQADVGGESQDSETVSIRGECLIHACESKAIELSPSLMPLLQEKPHRFTRMKAAIPAIESPASRSKFAPQPAVIWNRDQCSWHTLADGSLLVTETRAIRDFEPAAIPILKSGSVPFTQAQQLQLPILTTADGLPLIGANPSRSEELLCLGFQGWSSNFAAAAGSLAADLVLNGRSDYADLFSPRRLLL